MALTVEDRFAIQDVLARYGQAYTDNDAERFAALYSEDGQLEIGWSDVVTSRLESRKAIRDWAADVFRLMPAARIARIWTSPPVIEGARDKAVATCFFNNVSVTGESLATGVLKATLKSIKGNWRIAHLVAMTDGAREESAAKEALALARARR